MRRIDKVQQFLDLAPQRLFIQDTIQVADWHLRSFDRPLCSVSGGSDSDIMIDLLERISPHTVTYAFFDTGIEYRATKFHLEDLEEKYGIKIHRRPAVTPVPAGCKKFGQPFLSKYVSEMIERLQNHNFQWEDEPFDVLYARYPKCKAALRWWCNDWGDGSSFNISRNYLLKEFMIAYPPRFKISNKCCTGAKKKPAILCNVEFGANLRITGERQAESGARATANTSCFTPAKEDKIAAYRPLFFWSDADKLAYESAFGVWHSDCYRVWGMTRTGCAGCPFGSRFEQELEIIGQYEPWLYTAVNNIFGDSYVYTRAYRKFKSTVRKE